MAAASEDGQKCELMDWFGVLVQCILGVIVMSCLVLKRQLEKPRRSWKIWGLDVSKQCLGAGTAHVFNVGLSMLFATDAVGAQCPWYFLALTTDIFLGTLICYFILTFANKLFTKMGWIELVSGNYGDPPQYCRWFGQTVNWLWIVIMSKMFIAVLLFVARDALLYMAKLILSPVALLPKLQLIIVMVILPTVLNALQFWVQDNFLKMKLMGRFMAFRLPGALSAQDGNGGEGGEEDVDGVGLVSVVGNNGSLEKAFGKLDGPILLKDKNNNDIEMIVRGRSGTHSGSDGLPSSMGSGSAPLGTPHSEPDYNDPRSALRPT